MSSFSRGILREIFRAGSRAPPCRGSSPRPLLVLCARAVRPSRSHIWRGFHSSHFRLAEKPARAVSPPVLAPNTQSFAEILASKAEPTILYEAPSPFWYRFGTYTTATLWISFGLINYYTILVLPNPELPGWAAKLFSVVCIVLVGFGGILSRNSGAIITSVRAISAPQAIALGGRAVQQRAQATGAPLFLEVTSTSALPLMPPRKIFIPPADLVLPWPLHLFGRVDALDGKQVAARQRAAADEARRRAAYDKEHLLTAPFRHMRQALARLWDGVARSLFQSGFAKVRIYGSRYRMDILGAWALDKGRALDRLATVKDRNPPVPPVLAKGVKPPVAPPRGSVKDKNPPLIPGPALRKNSPAPPAPVRR